MNTNSENVAQLEGKIQEAEDRLATLEAAINDIGQPAAHELLRRLELLKIEGRALLRNFEESQRRGEPDPMKLEKIETLLQHIQDEESSVGHEADFLDQSNPSSVTLAVEAGMRLVEFLQSGFRHIIGDHHPLGSSVFVNHTHENLETEFGLEDSPDEKEAEKS